MGKKMTDKNWLEPDPVMGLFVKVSSETGTIEPMRGEDWRDLILSYGLLDTVPDEVQALFVRARDMLLAGYLYYGLYSSGMLELYRVAEAAIAHKCKILGAPQSPRKFGASFDENIKWLAAQGVIQEAEWQPIREARNFASHLKSEEIVTPAIAIGILEAITKKINDLFSDPSS